jgi:multiple sugar transport system ATP-binding protein
MAVVELKGLTKRYPGGAETAVDEVTLRIEHGEFFVLLGPSGCGKSTTLRMIAGLETITAGELLIDGRVVNRVAAKDRDIAMVFQSYALYPHMSVAQNLAFGLLRRSVPRAEIERRVAEVADKLELTPYLARRPHALSGGQRQRVALGRALVREPAVFLFDEPLSNLDAALRVSTRTELIRLHRELGATMIYVTHDQIEAMTMGTRICIMSRGRVAQIGRPMEVYAEPADMFVASFLGSPPMNLLPATGIAGGLKVGERVLRLAGVPAGPVMLGVRPEDLRLVPAETAMTLPAEVEAVEPLGAETLLVLRVAGLARELTLRGGRKLEARPGERVAVAPDPAAVRLFDPDSGRVLPWRAAHHPQSESAA